MKRKISPTKGAVLIATAGALILSLNLYIQTQPLFYSSSAEKDSTEKAFTVYVLIGAQTLLIFLIFSALSYITHKVLGNLIQVNNALLLSENRFRAIFEKAPLGIALTDPEKGIIYEANQTYLTILGLKKSDIDANTNWMKTTHPDDIEESISFSEKLIKKEITSFKQSKRYIHDDGSIVWANLTVSDIEIEKSESAYRIAIIENVTEQKLMELELQKKSKSLEEAQKIAKIGSWDYNAVTKTIKWSDEMYRILEIDKNSKKNLADEFKALCSETEISKITNIVSAAFFNGGSFSFEHTITCTSGKIKYLLFSGEVFKNKQGEVIQMIGTEQDITEQKKVQRILKEEEQSTILSRYASQVPGALYQFRFYPDGRFDFPFVSEGAKELCGFTPEQIKSNVMLVFNLVHPDDLEGLLLSVQQSMEYQKQWVFEFRIVVPAKGIKWIKGNANPEKLNDGSFVWHGYFNDTSESKKAEESLKISKSKLEAVFNHSNDAIILLTSEQFFDCNPKTLEMFELSSRKELVESLPTDLSPATQPNGDNSQTKARQMIDKAFNKGFNKFECVLKRKNGTLFPAEVLLSAFDYGEERVLQATIRDITEQKNAKKKIIENEALLYNILQTLPVAVFVKDIKKGFAFSIWNNKSENIFGIFAKECIGKTDYDLFPKKDADWYRQNDILACESNGIIDIKEEFAETIDKKIIIRTRKTVVKDETGAPVFLLGVSEDITEQKKAEEQLKRSEEKYRSVVENASDIIVTVNKEGLITFVNHRNANDEAPSGVGKSMFDYVPPEHHDLIKQKLKTIISKKTAQTFEIKGNQYSGGTDWYSVNAGPILFENQVVGITFITRNITERKKAEEQLKQSLKEKEILLKEVHHRVKNNLQIILSILNLQYNSIEDTKALGLLKDVRSRIKAMSFVHELLYQTNDFSKINFSEYVNNIANNLIYSYSSGKNILFKQDIDPVYLDLDKAIPCGLIINELVTNSLKYAFKNNESGDIFISLKHNQNSIKLIVADDGAGFPSSVNYKTAKTLGMQLVMALTEQIGGKIEQENNSGVRFIIEFNC